MFTSQIRETKTKKFSEKTRNKKLVNKKPFKMIKLFHRSNSLEMLFWFHNHHPKLKLYQNNQNRFWQIIEHYPNFGVIEKKIIEASVSVPKDSFDNAVILDCENSVTTFDDVESAIDKSIDENRPLIINSIHLVELSEKEFVKRKMPNAESERVVRGTYKGEKDIFWKIKDGKKTFVLGQTENEAWIAAKKKLQQS